MVINAGACRPLGAGLGGTGNLTVTSGHLALGAGTMGSISVTVLGGPVDWSATTTSKQLTLSSYQGTLHSQQSITLVVTVRRVKGTGGTAAVYIDPVGAAEQAVGVSWSSRPADSTPFPVRAEIRITVCVAFGDWVDAAAQDPGLTVRVRVRIAVPFEGHALPVSRTAADLCRSHAVRDPECALVVRSAVAAQCLTSASSRAGTLSLNGDR